jgi:hypothetical protein
LTTAEGTNQPANLTIDSVQEGLQWPRADNSSRYHAALKAASDTYPLVTEGLMRADRHRLRRWQQFIDPIDLEAIDSLLKYLASVSRSLNQTEKNHNLAFLPNHIADDVRISLEGLMSGHLQTVSDAMRDSIETELLIRDFALETSHIDKWLSTEEDQRWKFFAPACLRKRQAAALGINQRGLPITADYSAHSGLLHVGESKLFPRTVESGAIAGHRATLILDSLADIMYHGSNSIQALDSLMQAIAQSGPDSTKALSRLSLASDDLNQAISAVGAIERIAAEHLSKDKNVAVFLFESGLIITLNQQTRAASFYSTDRIDFRTFHRNVSEGEPANFVLTPLGESETAVNDSES